MSSSFLMVFLHASSRCFAPGMSLGFLWMAEISLRERTCNTLNCAPVTFTFFIVPPFTGGCSRASHHGSRNWNWCHASGGVNSAQRSRSAACRSLRRAGGFTHNICGYHCAYLRRGHASRRCASVSPIRLNNSLARSVLQEDDSARGAVSALRQTANCLKALRLERARTRRVRSALLLFASRMSLNSGCANPAQSESASSRDAGSFPGDAQARLVVPITPAAVCPTSTGHPFHSRSAGAKPPSSSLMIDSSYEQFENLGDPSPHAR